MTYEEQAKIEERVFALVRELRETKGKEYAPEDDTFADFKEVAAESGVAPLQCWAVYVKKHQRAIDAYIREGTVKSEAIEGRIIDVIVYHMMLLGLIEDLTPGPMARLFVNRVEEVRADAPLGHPNPYEILESFKGDFLEDRTVAAARARVEEAGFPGTVYVNEAERLLGYREDS